MFRRFLNLSLLLFLVIILLWLLSYTDNRQLLMTSQPISSDDGLHGLSQLNTWLSEAGYQTQSLTSSYETLARSVNRTGALMIVSLPAALPAGQQELAHIADWVNAGNTIMILAALDNQPHWHNKQHKATVDMFLNSFGLQLSQLDQHEYSETESRIITQLPSPLTAQIKSITSSTRQPAHTWQLQGTSKNITSLILLRDEASLSPVAWLSLIGKGRLFLFTHSDLFANGQLATTDNLVLAGNIITNTLPKNSIIYFDDIHHIITPPPLFLSKLMHPLLFLLAGMLGYAAISRLLQLMDQRKTTEQDSLQQHLRNMSIQNAQNQSDSQAALRYAAHFFNKVRARYGLPLNTRPVWDILRTQNHPKILEKVQQTYQRALAAKKVNLQKFIHRLNKLRTW